MIYNHTRLLFLISIQWSLGKCSVIQHFHIIWHAWPHCSKRMQELVEAPVATTHYTSVHVVNAAHFTVQKNLSANRSYSSFHARSDQNSLQGLGVLGSGETGSSAKPPSPPPTARAHAQELKHARETATKRSLHLAMACACESPVVFLASSVLHSYTSDVRLQYLKLIMQTYVNWRGPRVSTFLAGKNGVPAVSARFTSTVPYKMSVSEEEEDGLTQPLDPRPLAGGL